MKSLRVYKELARHWYELGLSDGRDVVIVLEGRASLKFIGVDNKFEKLSKVRGFSCRETKAKVSPMRLVILETPFAGDVKLNLRYLRACLRDCLLKGEAPFASHAIYTQPGVLNDDVLKDRQLGMEAGWAWRRVADATVVYTDLGITPGMQAGIDHAKEVGCPIWMRKLGFNWDKVPDEDGHFDPWQLDDSDYPGGNKDDC